MKKSATNASEKSEKSSKSRNSESATKDRGALPSEGNTLVQAENDNFNKHYNKELRVSKDEIPIVLSELNDSAIAFIKREQ